jgi:ribosomal protein S27AE
MVRFQCGKCGYIGSPTDFKSNYSSNEYQKARKKTRTCPDCGAELDSLNLHILSGWGAVAGGYRYKASKRNL